VRCPVAQLLIQPKSGGLPRLAVNLINNLRVGRAKVLSGHRYFEILVILTHVEVSCYEIFRLFRKIAKNDY
jgi:hypothetical protein